MKVGVAVTVGLLVGVAVGVEEGVAVGGGGVNVGVAVPKTATRATSHRPSAYHVAVAPIKPPNKAAVNTSEIVRDKRNGPWLPQTISIPVPGTTSPIGQTVSPRPSQNARNVSTPVAGTATSRPPEVWGSCNSVSCQSATARV